MKFILILSLSTSAALSAGAGDIAKESADIKIAPIARVQIKNEHGRTLWLTSISAMLAANSADVVTSYYDSKSLPPGFHELNPLVATNGQYDVRKGIAVKALVCGAILAYEIHDRRQNGSAHQKPQTLVNFMNAGIYAAVSMHNHNLSDKY